MTDLSLRVLAISPHMDDAVFGCGAALASADDASVCTIFTGVPPGDVGTDWDAQCGFSNARDAQAARIVEDDRALQTLGVAAHRLDFLDSQYVPHAPEAQKPTRTAIAHALSDLIGALRPRVLMMPLGLFHSDHELVHHACCDAWFADPSLTCIAYEEGLYRAMPGLVQQRLIDLHTRGIQATPIGASTAQPFDAERRQAIKREAVSAYTSQLKAFGPTGYDDVFLAERFWRLERAEDRR